MAKRTRKARKCRSARAKKVKAMKTARSAKRAGIAVRMNTAFKQPFSALHTGFSSVMSYFR